MKTKKTRNLFDEYDRLEKLSHKQDPLEWLNKYIDWNLFKPILSEKLGKRIQRKRWTTGV